MSDIYLQLAKYLDSLPAGFPPTDDGLELQILKKLFSPEEAALALHLSLLNEEVPLIARKAGLLHERTSQLLEGMVHKGLITGGYPKEKPPSYAISQFVIGFYEGQVNRLDEEIVHLVEAYVPIYFEKGPWRQYPQVRTIPVNRAIPITSEVMPYFQADVILQTKEYIAVQNCICRQERQILGQGCGKPMETCLTFDNAALNTVKTGKGRMITLTEALQVLEDAQAAGLVLQPANSRNPIMMCLCCDCCCGVLRHIKQEPNPSELVANPFIAQYVPATCISCSACVEICPMDTLAMDDLDQMSFESVRCIGCGLCTGVCPTGSMKLVTKPDPEQPKIPRDTTETYIQIARVQGVGKLFNLVKMWLFHQFRRLTNWVKPGK